VRECQKFLPQVYEIPKEHQRRLRESNELEAEVDPQEWERYKQVYYQQPVRSVLDVVNDIQSNRLPPQPPLVRGEQDFSAISSLVRGEQDFSAISSLVRGEQDFSAISSLVRGKQDFSAISSLVRGEQDFPPVPLLAKGGLGQG
jgi:ferredoxin